MRLTRSIANTVYAQELDARQSAVAWAETDQVRVRQGAVGFAQAEQARTEQSLIGVVRAKSVTLAGGQTGVVIADQADLAGSSALLVVSRTADGQPRLQFDPRSALLAGAAAGAMLGLSWLVGRLFTKR